MIINGANELPALDIAAGVNRVLAASGCAVVTAQPGAGKSTLLPLTMLQGLTEGLLGKDCDRTGRIIMLEPRRIAARQVAERMSQMVGEPVGQTIGYRVRQDVRVSSATRIEVVTEGILTRMLVSDPTLDGVQVVIFDEFHERNLQADLALALTRVSRQIIRPDLRLVVMSATIDASALCDELGATLVKSQGRMFPVSITYADVEPQAHELVETVTTAIRRALREHEGDILAFLPGEAEITACCEKLEGTDGRLIINNKETDVFPLYGNLSADEQRRAIAPSRNGERKVVLATNIAETSITIEGVRIVIDSGLCRTMRYNPQNGISRLETVRISHDMADQRSGRAGRVAPGHCYRLWTLATHHRMAGNRIPEVVEADLAPALLDVAVWGEDKMENLPWLTPPPPANVAQARRILQSLNAIDAECRSTSHGRRLWSQPCHPRIAQMFTASRTQDERRTAQRIADILELRDPMAGMKPYSADIRLRLKGISLQPGNSLSVGQMIALAFPERIAKASGNGVFTLATGNQVRVDMTDELSAHDWLAVASMNAPQGGIGRIFLAAPLDAEEVRLMASERDIITWDSRLSCVVARHEWRIGNLLVDAQPVRDMKALAPQIRTAICEAAPREGLSMFDMADDSFLNMQRRLQAVAGWHPELNLPDVSTTTLLSSTGEWFCTDGSDRIPTTAAELKKIDMSQVIWQLLTWEQQQAVERLAPSHIKVPSGSRIKVEYRQGAELPIIRVRLQECFGLTDTPRINDGRQPVLMELLSPGFKPVQLTQDLHSFWQGTYFEVRKELKRRYPKHAWPEDPMDGTARR